MADLGIIFLRRKHTIHWYHSLFTVITGSMPFRFFGPPCIVIFEDERQNPRKIIKYRKENVIRTKGKERLATTNVSMTLSYLIKYIDES